MNQLEITPDVRSRLSGSLARRWVPPLATLEHRGSTVYLVGLRDLLAEFARADLGNVTLAGEQHLKGLALFIP